VKTAPTNFKINNYVAQCYLAYGHADKAFSYIKDNPGVFSERYLLSAWSSLMSIASDYGSVEVMDKVLSEYQQVTTKGGLNPQNVASIMGFGSRIVYKLYSDGKYEEAIARADADLKKFSENIEGLKEHEFFTKEGVHPELRKYYYEVSYPSTMITVLNYRAMALIKLQKLEGIYQPFEEMLKAAEALSFADDSPYRAQPWYLKYRILYTISNVARLAGDTAKANDFAAQGKTAYEKFRAIYEEMSKK
jgi:hypothetical protein